MTKDNQTQIAPSRQTANKTIFAAFEILKSAGGQLPGKEVINRVREKVSLTDWEKQIYEKTGYVRWESIFHFFTIDCIKAGYLRKNKGVWYLTEEGDKATSLGPVKLLESATKIYRQWAAEINCKKPMSKQMHIRNLKSKQTRNKRKRQNLTSLKSRQFQE